ncbi:MAG: ComF family protein [Pseudomonadota bacterium]
MISRLARALGGIADVISPPTCPACGADTHDRGALCADCFAEMPFLSGALCSGCARPAPLLSDDEAYRCTACLEVPHRFTEARAAALYGGTARRMVLALKHADRLDLAPLMARWMLRGAADLVTDADLVVPVPLHWRRRLARRANQSAEIARHLVGQAGLPPRALRPGVLVRTRHTPSQGGFDRAARAANLVGAFALGRRAQRSIRGRRILLVDDVLTTSATLDAAAGVLLAGGARRVDAAVFAVVEGRDDPYVARSAGAGADMDDPADGSGPGPGRAKD